MVFRGFTAKTWLRLMENGVKNNTRSTAVLA